jgi:hypothetical protein
MSIFSQADEYQRVSWLFLRLLALIYLAAFASIGVQIVGLAGAEGILPFREELQYAAQNMGWERYLRYPTLFWLNSSDMALQALSIAGCVFSLLLFFNLVPRLSLILLFTAYLSLFHAGQIFMNFQWDYLLLEAGFLAVFLPGGSRLVIWLFRWLLFRLRFLSGAAKLLSGDPSWTGFTALNVYFETQPLPHIGAWYAHQLPEWLLRAGVGFVFFVELLVPFMMLLPRRFRLFAAAATILMQLLILFTSNHNYFNLLTILLCLFLLDDKALERITPRFPLSRGSAGSGVGRATIFGRIGLAALSGTLFLLSTVRMAELSTREPFLQPLAQIVERVKPFRVVNNYHVFPIIQRERIELVIEGSRDGKNWSAYRFKYKPQELSQMTPVVIPHQPRLDWMLWFVPLGHPLNLMWFDRFMQRLHENSPVVTELLEENPFLEKPPKYVRVSRYRYRFASPEAREKHGIWWEREYLGPFFPGL